MSPWQRSSFCSDNVCVEVMRVGETVLVRDSKHPDEAPLGFTEAEWRDFLARVRAGEFG